MADDALESASPFPGGNWRRNVASAIALLATLLLLGLVVMVAVSSRDRDKALEWERETQNVIFLTSSVDASMARSEAALGRFVIGGEKDMGALYYSQWRIAGRQLGQLRRQVNDNPDQRRRVAMLEALYRERGEELGASATRANYRQGWNALAAFDQAGKSPSGPRIATLLRQIADAERSLLRGRLDQTQRFSDRASFFTDLLSWLGLLIGFGAIVLGWTAIQAVRQNQVARRLAEFEAERAETLEYAVAERTWELEDVNERLRQEAVERASAEAQLRQAQKMEVVGQLTGGIAHDFNNMLAVVVGGLDLAKRRLDGPRHDVERHLDNAMEGATRAAALTRRLLSFARSEPLNPEGVDSSALISGMSDLLDRTLGERIVIETDFEAEPWPVFVDPHQLENAILNLAVNARDAMEGTGTLRLATNNIALDADELPNASPGDYLRVSVSDTGCGMAPEIIERAFEPFFTTKPVGKGTGLGLSQIFGFARQSGGEVAIASRAGEGTTVSLYLPRVGSAAFAAAQVTPIADAAKPADHALDTARILVVEDDPRVRVATVGALEELGYDPVSCGSGVEALAIFRKNGDFTLLITDVIMPEMTGPELAALIRAERPEIAILFVTGYVGEAGEKDALIGGEILRKPFTVAALANAVADAMARSVSAPRPAPKASAAG